MKTLIVLLVVMFQATSTVAIAEESDARRQAIREALKSTGAELGSYTISVQKGQVRTSVQCIDGYKFAIVAMAGHQAAPGPAVELVQVYENDGDKMIPAKCET